MRKREKETGKRNTGVSQISNSFEKMFEFIASQCIPEGIENMQIEDYDRFLSARRQLMAQRIKEYFSML